MKEKEGEDFQKNCWSFPKLGSLLNHEQISCEGINTKPLEENECSFVDLPTSKFRSMTPDVLIGIKSTTIETVYTHQQKFHF